MYLQALQDSNTNSINLPIWDVIQYLYDTYRDIFSDLLAEKRTEVEGMTYDPSLPINVLFTTMEKYTNIAESTGAPISQTQCTNITYIILKRAGTLSDYLLKWDQRPNIQKTWIQFKVDFQQTV